MLTYDRQIKISSAGNRRAMQWPTQTLYWSELVDKLRTPVRGTETLGEYTRMAKSQQDDLKDVGGFVGGTLADNRRKLICVTGRDVLSLDLDNIGHGQTLNVLQRIDGLGCGYAVYSTRKHEEVKPRLRVLVPLNRTASVDEYEPLARKLTSIIGIELADPTTFEPHRLMYWPSCCADSQYVFQYGDKPFLDADGLLSLYVNWRNVLEWPQVPGAQQTHERLAAKQGNPTEKAGVVGAFCKVYDVYKAIETFLPTEYTPCDDNSGRFSFTGGSTTGGAVIYDNGNFLFSHHATDPAGGKLCNAFDLVRHHKFNEMDNEAKPDTPTNKLPSYSAMCELALQNTQVAGILASERYTKATEDFAQDPAAASDDPNWVTKLEINSTGAFSKTINNILVILEHDPLLKGALAYDDFANLAVKMQPVPWDRRPERRRWQDADNAGLRNYLERTYKIFSPGKVNDAQAQHLFNHTFNDVEQYLKSLVWDGTSRLNTLLSDYLGAADTEYTRTVIRKALVAAVARALTPGCKFDYMPMLTGPQGLGKSTFLRLLGKHWFSENLRTFEGKEASELIQGKWIIEVGELEGFNRSEVNSIKQFLSTTTDVYRVPFDKITKDFPRKCVIFGTTNENEFLRDATGNRRFWPVNCGIFAPLKSVFKDLAPEVDQIWAEAVCYWKLGESLFLSGAVESEAAMQQEAHFAIDPREGLIREFINRPLPLDWEERKPSERSIYWAGEFGNYAGETMARDKVCAAEVMIECLGMDPKYIKQTDTRAINSMLKRILIGWDTCREKFSIYGNQRGYKNRDLFRHIS